MNLRGSLRRQSLGRAADAMARSGSLIAEALEKHSRHHGTGVNLDRPPTELTRCSGTAGAAYLECMSEPHALGALGDRVRWPDSTTGEARAVECAAPTGTAGRNQAGRRPHVGGPALLPRGLASKAVREAAWCPGAAFCSGPAWSSFRAAPALARRPRPVDSEGRTLGCRHATVWA
jgi:hypothetical protein